MGLDMYLDEVDYQGNPVAEIAYWRKANQIHNWFVNNVQGGEDDCKQYAVAKFQLRELVRLCKEVLAARDKENGKQIAEELLPTCEGFFFGSTEYNDDYYYDLENTIEQLEQFGFNTENDIVYQSSW